jgi:tetratricopeptide (TPR) repeat protein
MTRLRRSLSVLIFALFSAIQLHADIIVLYDGGILVVTKAWVEGDEVKYQTSRGVQSLPRARVREIQQETPSAPPGPQRWSLSSAVASSGATSTSPAASTSSGPESAALTRLRENLKAAPSDPRAKAELIYALDSVASLQLNQGDLPAARGTLEEALGLDRRNPVLLANLAVIHLRMGNHRDAQGLLETCLEIDRNDRDIHYLLGEAYYGQEKISEAINQWTAGLKLGAHPAMSRSLDKARQEARAHEELSTLQSAHFILRYDQKVSDNLLGYQILATLEKLYTQLTNELTSRPPATIAVILYPNQTYFDITRAATWSGALFDGKIRVPTKGLTTVTPDLTATLIHELTHSFIDGLPGRGCPAWFNEGVAQFQEGETAAAYRTALARLRQNNQLPPLRVLEETFADLPAAAADLAYTESLAVVEYLVTQSGRSSIRSILELMAQNYNFESAFRTVTKRSVAEFEAAWHLDLTR